MFCISSPDAFPPDRYMARWGSPTYIRETFRSTQELCARENAGCYCDEIGMVRCDAVSAHVEVLNMVFETWCQHRCHCRSRLLGWEPGYPTALPDDNKWGGIRGVDNPSVERGQSQSK